MTEQNFLAVGQPEGSTTHPGCFFVWKMEVAKKIKY